jgi:carbamoyltransferase
MAKKLLGLRLCEHDSNLSYFDGENVHYLKTERVYEKKHHAYDNLIDWQEDVQKYFKVNPNEIDQVAVVIDPWRHNLPVDNEEFFPAVPYKYFPHLTTIRVNHHYAHALSCWPLQKERPKFEVVIDGFGDANNAWTVFIDNKIYKRGHTELHGSLGLSMSEAGMKFGIGHEGAESYDLAGKLMGLQSYGKILPDFSKKLNFNMNTINDLFNFNLYTDYKQDNLLAAWQPLDWIRTVHDKVSEILINFFEEITKGDYDSKISYSGGVAQNVIWNTALKNKWKNLIIPPHCSDEGLSLGALEYLRIKNNLPEFKIKNFPYIQTDESPADVPDDNTINKVVHYLQQGKTVAWYQGHGEIGPRALGNRSLLFNPEIKNGKKIINNIKKRESFRPFGASILSEFVHEYFNTNLKNPHMLYVGNVRKLNLDCVTHVDGTCRYQSVDKENVIYYKLLSKFYEKTGCPILLNTSLNVRGKPIMANIKSAKDYLNNSEIDVLVVGNKIYK